MPTPALVHVEFPSRGLWVPQSEHETPKYMLLLIPPPNQLPNQSDDWMIAYL